MKILILDDDFIRHEHFSKKFSESILKHVYNSEMCIEALKNEDWDVVFLDHDLGGKIYVNSNEENTGYQVAKWLSNHKDRIPNKIFIHSYNSVGSKNMKSLLPNSILCPGVWLQ